MSDGTAGTAGGAAATATATATTRLYLVRHGEVEAGGKFYGHLDVPLSARGLEQMRAAAEALAPLEVAEVASSDLARAVDGARFIAERHGLAPVLDPAFREMSLGVLEGLPFSEARRLHPELARKRYADMWVHRFPEGENLADVEARVLPRLEELLARNEGRTVVLVAHNSVNRILLGRALGLPLEKVFGFSLDFGCVSWLEHGPHPRVGLLNWTPGAPI
jgi:alpha-ribazole phosphatase